MAVAQIALITIQVAKLPVTPIDVVDLKVSLVSRGSALSASPAVDVEELLTDAIRQEDVAIVLSLAVGHWRRGR